MIFGAKSIDSLSGGLKTLTGRFADYIKTLDIAKVKTIGLKVATVALESAFTLGITYVISKAIEKISEFTHAEEKALEEARKFRQDTIDNLNSYKEESQENNNLLSSYVNLVSTTSDLTKEKEKLLDIQNKINESIENQTDKVDLLNKSLSENVELTTKQRLEEAKRVVAENQSNYESVLEGQRSSYVAMLTYGDKSVDKAISEIEQATGMRVSGTLAEQSEQLEEILEKYRLINGYNKTYYNDLVKGKQAIDTQLSEWETIKETVESAQKTIDELTVSPDIQKTFNELIDKAETFYKELSGDGTVEQKFIASEKLQNIKGQLYELVNGNTELSNTVDVLFSSFEEGTKVAIGSVGNLKEAWLNTLDDMQKGSLKNISTMVSALQDLSENKGIAANTFWQLVEFDEEGLLNGARLVGDKFYVAQENLIKLKDKYVQSQIDSIRYQQVEIENQKKQYEEQVKLLQLRLNAWKFSEKPLTNIVSRKEYENLNSELENAKRGAKEFGDEWERNNWLIEYLNQSLGNTIDKQKELESRKKEVNKQLTSLNKELDNYVKAYEKKIDGIVDGLELEQKELENQKQTLQDELDILNEQKDVLEDTIKNYESVNKLVQDTVKKEIDSLEEQKKAIEDTYNKRIEALKTENEEREDALEYAQKLANLENARNNKRRVLDETRGWRYESVKEDVVKAENDLATFENSQAIKQLEKERDEETAIIDNIIKEKEAYSKEWGDILDLIQTEEDELLAAEILGADWREKIASGDIEVMEKFRTAYISHNTALRTLTGTEIKLQEEAIKAKDAEIKSKKEQIDSWKDYKTTVTKAVQDIKDANEGYMKQIGDIELSETSSLEDRERAFATFKEKVTGYINDIAGAQGQLEYIQNLQDNLGGSYDYDIRVNNLDDLEKAASESRNLAMNYAGFAGVAMAANGARLNTFGQDVGGFMQEFMGLLGFSQGGVADYTGLAMLHGRKNAPETIFNATDSAKLYELVHNTPNLMADVIAETRKIADVKAVGNSNTTNSSLSIGAINVYANNPTELSRGLDKELDKYFRTKLTQSYTQK